MLSSSGRLATTTTQDENASAVKSSARKAVVAATPGRRAFADAANKTPAAATLQRRAFGDISNHKAAKSTKHPTTLRKSQSTTSVFSSKQQQTSKTTIKKPAAAASSKRVEFTLPTETKIESVPDVELPAGRLWSEQPDWDDLHEPDDDEVSLEGAATVREDALRFVEERHKLRLQAEDEHDAFCIKFMEESAHQFMASQGK